MTAHLPVNKKAVADLAESLLDQIEAAPPNSTILLRVVIDPHRRVSPATKMTVELFPLRDSDDSGS